MGEAVVVETAAGHLAHVLSKPETFIAPRTTLMCTNLKQSRDWGSEWNAECDKTVYLLPMYETAPLNGDADLGKPEMSGVGGAKGLHEETSF